MPDLSDFFDPNRPTSIIFFPNGTAAVCGPHGQIPKYQRGWHGTTIEALKADGIEWWSIPERLGSPLKTPPAWWSPERQARQDEEDGHRG